jgi:hypothetical protein
MLLILIALAFVILFGILCWLNFEKIYTFNDVVRPVVKNTGPIVNPIVYQLVYISSSGTTWTFVQNETFLNDWATKRVNYLLIDGTLYSITSVKRQQNMILTLETTCNTMASFTNCEDTQPNWTTNNTLYVLGYML